MLHVMISTSNSASFVEILRYPPQVVVDGLEWVEPGGAATVSAGQMDRQTPVPKPRHRQTNEVDAAIGDNGTPPPLVLASNLTPSRSAPAPPTSSSQPPGNVKHGTLPKYAPPTEFATSQQFGTLPKPKPRNLPRTTSSSSRVDILVSELTVGCKKIG